jgi:protein O-mannosyl-transferase
VAKVHCFKVNLSSLKISMCLLLAVLTLAGYWGVRENDFVSYDDYSYITQNPHVRDGLSPEGVLWAFTSRDSYNWHPLTWLSHMLDFELYGLNPSGHHWNSLILHLVNTLLLFLLLHRMTGSLARSGLAAALFSLHPLHVESVAWASERKDVLCTFFWMMAVLVYVEYTRKPGGLRYALALLLMTMALMSKPMAVTLPFVLLLLDFWPLRRFHSVIQRGEKGWTVFVHLAGEKIPFFALSLLSSILTFLIQEESGAVGSEIPIGVRLSTALIAYVRYLFKMFRPVDLTCFYPYSVDLTIGQVLGSFLLLLAITLVVFRWRRNRPYLPVGWLWYLGTLVPVIGLIQVGEQAMADRYTYIPLIGIFLMIAWGIPHLDRRRRFRGIALGLSTAAILAILILLTRQQVAYWRNSLSLFEHEVQVQRDSFLAHFHLATALEERGRMEEASVQYAQALLIRPGFQRGHYHLGNALAKLGRDREALNHFSEALKIDPEDYRSHNNMGFVLLKEGRYREAAEHFSEALRIHPEDRMAGRNLDLALRRIRESANP